MFTASLGDADIEGALRECLVEDLMPVARHRSRLCRDLVAFFFRFLTRLWPTRSIGRGVGILPWPAAGGHAPNLPRRDICRQTPPPADSLAASGSRLGPGFGHPPCRYVLHHRQRWSEVMAVDRADVGEAEFPRTVFRRRP